MIVNFFTFLFNLILIIFLLKLSRRKNFLIEFSAGRWWFTFISISLPVLILQLSSIFYATGESFKYLGYHSIFFIIFSTFFYNYISTRYIEIAEILHHHKINGEGLFGFVNMVLGSEASFIFASSIVVTYLLTICISSVSVIGNNLYLLPDNDTLKIFLTLFIIWGITFIELLGIKISQKIYYYLLVFLIILFINLIILGFLNFDNQKVNYFILFFNNSIKTIIDANSFEILGFIIFGISINSLFFNGNEMVISNSNYVRNWRLCIKTYILIFFVLIVIVPVLTSIIFSSNLNIIRGEIFFLPYYSYSISGDFLRLLISISAIFYLSIAIKISMNNIAEILNLISKKINFFWLIKLNKRSSYYRINILTAIFSSIIVVILQSNQKQLAELLAFGILVNISFLLFTLLVYRYFLGSKEISIFDTSKLGTLFLFLIVFGGVVYLFFIKVVLTFLWIIITSLIFFVLFKVFKTKNIPQLEKKILDNPMDLIFYISDNSNKEFDIYFTRPREHLINKDGIKSVYINFCSQSDPNIPKKGENHFRFQYIGSRLLPSIIAIIELLKYELPDVKLKFHFGWPLSSWIDRLSVGVMVFSLMKLPKQYPEDEFVIEYFSVKKA